MIRISGTDRVKRCLVHIPVGVVAALLFLVGEYLGVGRALGYTFTVGFGVYELNEDRHLRDGAWKDIFGYLVGFAVMAFLMALVKLGLGLIGWI